MFEIQFETPQKCAAKYSQLCANAQSIGLDREAQAHIFELHDNKIIFLRSPLHCGVLFPSFFKSLPIIADKIADQEHTVRRNGRGHYPQEISNIVISDGILNLRNHDIDPKLPPYKPELLEAALQVCTRLPDSQFQLETQSKPKNTKKLVKLLSNTQGFVVGETHPHLSSKRFLIENFGSFRKQGFSVFCCEHLLADDHQELLNYWYEHPEQPMPRELELYLCFLDRTFGNTENYPDNFLGLIQAAHKTGFKIIAIDNSQTYTRIGCELPYDDHVRLPLLNANTVEIVEKLNKGEDCQNHKPIIFCGSGHLGSRSVASSYGKTEMIHGIDKLLSIPSVVVSDQPGSTEQINTDVNEGARGIQANFHLLASAQKRFDVQNIHTINDATKAYLDIITDDQASFIINHANLPACVFNYLLSKVNNLEGILKLLIHFSCDSKTDISIIENLCSLLEKKALRESLSLDQIYLLLIIECSSIFKNKYGYAAPDGFNKQIEYLFRRSLEFNIQKLILNGGHLPIVDKELSGVNLQPLFIRWFPESEVVKEQRIAAIRDHYLARQMGRTDTIKDHYLICQTNQMNEVLDMAVRFCNSIDPPKATVSTWSFSSLFATKPKCTELNTGVARLRRTIDKIQAEQVKSPGEVFAACRAILHILKRNLSDLKNAHYSLYNELTTMVQTKISLSYFAACKAEFKSSCQLYSYLQSHQLDMTLHEIDGAANFLALNNLADELENSPDYQLLRNQLTQSSSPEAILQFRQYIEKNQGELRELFAIPPKFLFCPLTHEMMKEPVTIPETGNTYERVAVESWFREGNITDPGTMTPLKSTKLMPNLELEKETDEWLTNHSDYKPEMMQQSTPSSAPAPKGP